MDFQFNARSPKTPPLEPGIGHIQDPIGLEPLGHVVVASHRHESARDVPATNPLGNRRRANLGNVAIDHAGEFVENNKRLSAVGCRLSAVGKNAYLADS
jgi:hypothetical protein